MCSLSVHNRVSLERICLPLTVAGYHAIAAGNGMDYILAWNFRHIANAYIREKLYIEC
jgi:hypothetical protein